MDTKEENMQRCEEVQTIIDRMPTKGAIYIIALTTILITTIIVLGFIIKYPETVDGQVSITAHLAPIKLVSNISGKLHILYENKELVNEGQIISYIDNGASYKDVLLIDSLLKIYNQDQNDFPIQSGVILGEISSTFNSFIIACSQYHRMLNSSIYKTMRSSLQQQNIINYDIIDNINKEISLKQ